MFNLNIKFYIYLSNRFLCLFPWIHSSLGLGLSYSLSLFLIIGSGLRLQWHLWSGYDDIWILVSPWVIGKADKKTISTLLTHQMSKSKSRHNWNGPKEWSKYVKFYLYDEVSGLGFGWKWKVKLEVEGRSQSLSLGFCLGSEWW